MVLGDRYHQKHIGKIVFGGYLAFLLRGVELFSGPCTFWGRKKTPEAAAGHNTLVLRTKTLLASMAHECTDRTSRRAEIPPVSYTHLRAHETV